jgi:puromycin-sensitive aminopeptidase
VRSENDPYRLPTSVVPSHYDLTLQPELEEAVFSGSVRIRLTVTEPVSEIVLNAKELEIDEALLSSASGPVPVVDVTLLPALERAAFALASPLPAGEYELELRFRGILNDKLAGFYRSSFRDDRGEQHLIATSQLQSTDARRAFPCFDEPAFKATFGVTLIVPEALFAVSNGPVLSEEPAGSGKRRVRFAPTMKMSTYLVAFAVGPFEATEPIHVDGVPLRIVHPKGKGHLTGYAKEVGAFALRFFSEYYGIAYPGQKLDLVAIPDFAYGAMENLGCVTFREVLLLVDESRATQADLVRLTDVVAHEIAHMWFGDLVTMRWWDGTWLNEAFATFMATSCTAAFRPEWRRWDQFGRERSAAFDVDALSESRSIEFPVRSPSEAEAMFDVLTYEKGASVLRMLEQYLEPEHFREGIRRYLRAHAYGNTDTRELWGALEQATGQPVRRIMDSWIYQPGFPLVTVATEGEERLALRQQRFLYSGSPKPEPARWAVPVVLRCSEGGTTVTQRVLLENEEAGIELAARPDWLLVNAGSCGFYRVRYEPELFARLSGRLQSELSPAERYTLVDDTWAAVVAGSGEAAGFLRFVEQLGNEEDLDVWLLAAECLAAAERLVEGDARAKLWERLRPLFRSPLTRLGWEPSAEEGPRTRQLRSVLVRALASLAKDPEALARGRALHEAYLADPRSVEPNLAAAAAAAVAAHGTPADFELFVRRFREAETPQEERKYRFLLAAFPGRAELELTLEMTVNGIVRTQDAPYLVGVCLEHREHGAIAWSFLETHWERMLRAYPDASISRMLAGIRVLSAPGLAERVLRFFEEHRVPKGERSLRQHLEKLRINASLREREAERLPRELAGR